MPELSENKVLTSPQKLENFRLDPSIFADFKKQKKEIEQYFESDYNLFYDKCLRENGL